MEELLNHFYQIKDLNFSKINPVNKDEVISDDSTLVETFSKYFESAVKNLGVSEEINTRTDFESSDPVDIALLKFKYHPSVLKIKEFIGKNVSDFHFSETIKNIENEIKKLNVSEKGTFKNISPKCLLQTLDVSGPVLLNIWNEGILKVVSTAFLLVCFICLKERTCEARKNVFYFT